MAQRPAEEEVFEHREERAITDELLALARSRIGAELPVHAPYNEEASADGIRHFAHGMGDDNPIYWDAEYAGKTRWGRVMAPPVFYRTMGIGPGRERTQEEREMARDPLSGIHSWYSGDAIRFLQPIYSGDRLTARRFRSDYIEKRSEFAGRIVIEVIRTEYWNQCGDKVVVSDQKTIRGGRQQRWGERKKYADIARQTYSPEDIRRVDADYQREERRGATPRYWEDVAVGDEIIPVVKGPLTATDIMNWNMGYGIAMQFHGAHRLAYRWREKHPRAYIPNSSGIPDLIEAVHWDDDFARKTGNPMAYDYGAQRIAWLAHGVTNWMGDEGWLHTLDCQIRRFGYHGDTVWVKGRVSGKRVQDGEHVVEMDVWAEDQRDRMTALGYVTVLLPSREHGPVSLPSKLEL